MKNVSKNYYRLNNNNVLLHITYSTKLKLSDDKS